MKRALTIVQKAGMEKILAKGPKRMGGPDCAFCRNSQTVVVEGKLTTACKGPHTAGDGVAKTCEDFKDSRVPLATNYLFLK